MTFGERLKEARKNRGLKQKELASLIGVTPSAITNYENGVSHPKEDILYKLFNTLDVEPNFLFQDSFKTENPDMIAAHHDNDEWTEEELAIINQFKAALRKNKK